MPVKHVMLVTAILLLASGAGRQDAPPDGMVDVGTHRLHAVVAGEGVPAVVIDGGIGALCGEYRALQDRLATATTVVAYDRAGYGASEGGPLPRDSGREAEELRALLAALGIPGPYVLVGHSLGGLNAQVFAARHPDEVAGLVLLDPPPRSFILGEDYAHFVPLAEQMTRQWQEVADRGLAAADAGRRAQAAFFRMLASEHRQMLDRSAHLAGAIETFGDIPLVVVASGVPNPFFGEEAAAYQEYWIDQNRALSARSGRGRLVLARDSSHRLHQEALDLVVENVLAVLAEAR
jgi:pimeloyl-ACP methyl ester carboxylesterase